MRMDFTIPKNSRTLRSIMENFLLEQIEIYNQAGDRLIGTIVESIPLELPEAGVFSGGLMQHTLEYTFSYQFKSEPATLTFKHEIVDENFLFPSELKILIKQAGSDQPTHLIMKQNTPETVQFDWNNLLKKEATGQELEDWFETQREKTLGITSYGSVYSFVYITPLESKTRNIDPAGEPSCDDRF